MPVTASGTSYTVHYDELPGHGTCVWSVADFAASETNLPTILYAHGAGGAPDQMHTLPLAKGLRDTWLDGGGVIVEGGGGPTDAAGAQNWGNDGARQAYPAYLDSVAAQLDLRDVAVIGRSMGGLVGAYLASRSALADSLSGFITMSGVSTMLVGSGDSSAPAADRNTVRYFATNMWAAYGQTSYEPTAAAVAGEYAPEDWDAAVWAGRNILALYGTADTSVPWNNRGGGPLAARWAANAAEYREVVRGGGDHGANGTWLNVAEMAAFLGDVTSWAPAVPPVTDYGIVHSRFLIGADGLHYELKRVLPA